MLINASETKTLPQSETLLNYNVEKRKVKIWKNLFILSIAFMLNFTTFQPLQNLQSTLNTQGGIGTISLSLLYASVLLSSLFFPTLMIKYFGAKYSICFSFICFCIYIISNFKAEWHYFSLPISAILVGLSSAPLWASHGSYINSLGSQLADITSEKHENVIPIFFGLFAFFFASAQIWGNLISYYILGLEKKENSSLKDLQLCGKNFCPSLNSIDTHNISFNRPSDNQIYMLCGVYLAIGILAFLLTLLFLDNENEKNQNSQDSFFSTITKTAYHMTNIKQIILIPFSIYIGLEVAFIASEFTQAFISCSWDISKIGYVMMSYGTTNCLSSLLCGILIKFTSRKPFFILALIIQLTLLVILSIWNPSLNESTIFFIIAILWGLSDAILLTQCFTLYGSLFIHNQEAGFSNKCLWESIGFTVAFAYSSYLCTAVKIYILLFFASLSSICYCLVEYLHQQKKKSRLY